eukprot:scaffold49665_cov36-Tisochrysis_lutea.AAC.1
MVRPKIQQTAENVANIVWPGVAPWAIVFDETTCQGFDTVCRSLSGTRDWVPMPTVKMRMW